MESERELIADAPTQNMEAYQAFLQAQNLEPTGGDYTSYVESKTQLLDEATTLDPNFAEAWAALSRHHSSTYTIYDHTDARLSQSRAALQRARELSPNSHHTRLAAGYYHYYGFREYDEALEEFLAAAADVPNDSDCRRAIGYIHRRQGKWAQCLENLKVALELDPQDANLALNIAGTYVGLREFEEAIPYYDRAIRLLPNSSDAAFQKANTIVAWKGDLKAARAILVKPELRGQFLYHVGLYMLASMERNIDEAIRQAQQLPDDSSIFAVAKKHIMSTARAMAVGPSEAREDLEAAARALEELLEVAPSNDVVRRWYALNLALRGQDAAAVREAKLAVDLTAKDAFEGPTSLESLAQVYAHVGRHEEAIDLIERLLGTVYAGAINQHFLKLDPVWDPLRDNPRFEALFKKQT
jgi:serine/threonine-protein kinase